MQTVPSVMAVVTEVTEPNIWEEVCKEYEARRPPFKEEDKKGIELINYDPSVVSPVFYGRMHQKIQNLDADVFFNFDPSISHPACVGHTFIEKPPPSPPPKTPPLPDKNKCSPREYLEAYIFPYLLPALEEMLKVAKKEKCFERRRTKFNALDYLTEHLYKNNPNQDRAERADLSLFDIAFVQSHLKDHPRPPLPLSLIWTEEEAALVIQSHYRGYMVRRQSEIQELRQWQKEWREENANIRNTVEDFWANKMPDGTDTTS